MLLYERIRTLRKAAKMTQSDLADAVGVSIAAVAQWESADPERRTRPTIDNLVKIAEAVSASVDLLLSDATEVMEEGGDYIIADKAFTLPMLDWHLHPVDSDRMISPDPSLGRNAFILRMETDVDIYRAGEFIAVDPDEAPRLNDHLVVKLEGDAVATLRTLSRDGGRDILIPLSSHLPGRERLPGDQVVGVVMARFSLYRQRR